MRAHFGPERPEQEEEFEQYPTRSATILAKWAEYEHGMIDFSKRFDDAFERLCRFKTSPLLSRELKTRIEPFEKIVTKNLYAVGDVMTDIAEELPEKYPQRRFARESTLDWIWNRYDQKRERLGKAKTQWPSIQACVVTKRRRRASPSMLNSRGR
jgi:hypothetical protein